MKNIKMLLYVKNRKKEYLNDKSQSTIIVDNKTIKLERINKQNIETDWNNNTRSNISFH